MTMQEAKQYLRQVKRADDIVKSKMEQLSNLKDLAFKVGNSEGKERVQMSQNNDKIGGIVAKIVDLESELNKDIDRLVDLKTEIGKRIDKVQESEYRLLLMHRYLDFKTWEDIAEKMGYSVRWVRGGLHCKALCEIEKNLG